MRIFSVVSIICAVLLTGNIHGVAYADDARLPDDVKIVPPEENVSPNIRQFSGAWRGKWAGNLDQIVVVEEVRSTGKATILYAWGDYAGWNVTHGWVRTKAEISGAEMEVDRFRNGAEVLFKLEGHDTMSGDYWRRGRLTEGTFSRMKLPLPE